MKMFETDNAIQRKYDEICGVAYVNMYTLTKDKEAIVISPFNPKNSEHLFVFYIAKSLGGIFNKKVYVDTNYFRIAKLNKKVDKDNRVKKKTKNMEFNVNPDTFLNDLRGYAQSKCGMNFSFGNIYNEFYSSKGKRK